MKLRIDTLFGRMALLIAAVLFISHFSWLAILRMDRRQQQIDYSVEQMMFQLQSIERALDAKPPVALPSLIEVADTAAADEHSAEPAPGRPRRLVEQFVRQLPAGTQIRLEDETTPRLWIKLPTRAQWIAMPILFVHNPPPDNRMLPGVVLVVGVAIVFALLIAWQIQRPVRDIGRSRRAAFPPARGQAAARARAA